MDDFDRICDFSNLYTAHLMTRLGKRHKAEVIRFESDLGHKLTQLSRMLKEDRYLPVKYYHFKVYEPKERNIHALRYPDRVVQRCLCDQVLLPVFEPRLIYDNAACRKGKGVHFSIGRLSRFMREHFASHGAGGYVLKCDIKRYFQSIDHEILKQLLAPLPFSDRTLRLLFGILDSFEDYPGQGLPLGNQSSQWFALYYLDKVDRLIKEKLHIKHYVRYMDDFVLLHPEKSYLRDAEKQIEKLLKEQLGLALNEKTQLSPLDCGVRYLGFSFHLTGTGKIVRKLLPAAKKRILKASALLDARLSIGEISVEDVAPVLSSYMGHMKHGHCQGLERHLSKVLAMQ